ncbi:MAG: peptidoglycan-binding protein [Reyranellaceae bacterium]
MAALSLRGRLVALLVAAVVLGGAGPALAVDAKGSYSVRGIGSQSCETAVASAEKDANAAASLASWMLGYLSAANRYEQETFDLVPVTDARAMASVLVALCRKAPKSPVENVLVEMLRAMARARLRADSPLVETKSGNAAATVRQEVLLSMQQRLNQRGLLKAKADGTYGPQTEAAFKEYQKAEKLPVTGVADAATVLRMLVEQAPAAQPAPAPAPPAPAAPAQPRR